VGTLFGKTLDVDMAYTRKNKVLRTKIGCLDHRLIPADSDMFIRRGFYKLRFEVEIEEQSHEVNMVDANNGSDGNNGDNQGEEKNGDAHDMDMDNKEKDTGAEPKGNDQEGSNSHNGGEGMQKQCDFLEAIQFGTMDANCASPGNPYNAKNLNQIGLVFIPKSHNKVSAQNDNFSAVFMQICGKGDILLVCWALGSVRMVRTLPLGRNCLSLRQHGMQLMGSRLQADNSRRAALSPGPLARRHTPLAGSLCPSVMCRRLHAGAEWWVWILCAEERCFADCGGSVCVTEDPAGGVQSAWAAHARRGWSEANHWQQSCWIGCASH
jgi:hypothetical protein